MHSVTLGVIAAVEAITITHLRHVDLTSIQCSLNSLLVEVARVRHLRSRVIVRVGLV